MKLEQGQVWKQGEEIYRIVKLERLAVEYIELAGPHALHRLHHHVSKKAFCRLIKGAELVDVSHVAGGDDVELPQPD